MNATEFVKAVDHAAGMNDRWLFWRRSSSCCSGCGVVIIGWCANCRLSSPITRNCGRRITRALAQIIEKQNETVMKLAVCIDHNTEALRECAFELRRFQERKEA
jgi:hypothetical protein